MLACCSISKQRVRMVGLRSIPSAKATPLHDAARSTPGGVVKSVLAVREGCCHGGLPSACVLVSGRYVA